MGLRRRTRTVDLGELLEPGSPVIAGRTFTGQLVEGPAVIYPFDSTFEGCEWTADFDATFWPVTGDRERVVGVVFVERCRFVDCVFNGVGIAAPVAERERYRDLWAGSGQR